MFSRSTTATVAPLSSHKRQPAIHVQRHAVRMIDASLDTVRDLGRRRIDRHQFILSVDRNKDSTRTRVVNGIPCTHGTSN